MAHPMLKLYSLLMYVLAFISFFFLGILFANITEAGKGQMLAGGAIVLGYGVIGAIIGLLLSLLAAYKVSKKQIIFINAILVLLIGLSLIFFTINYKKRQQDKQQETEQHYKPATTIDEKVAEF